MTRPIGRRAALIALLFVLGLAAAATSWQRYSEDRRRAAEYQAHLSRQIAESQAREQQLVDNGEVWAGELHEAIADPDLIAEAQAAGHSGGLLNQQRIAGTAEFPELGLAVSTELHECRPGSKLCSTGGSIQVMLDSHCVCSVSVGLLQLPSASQSASHYRIAWQHGADGQPLTEKEKRAIVRQLAHGARSASSDDFQQLLRAAYTLGSHATEEHESHVRLIVSTIFATIAAQRS